jgi:cytochrome c peroxidase
MPRLAIGLPGAVSALVALTLACERRPEPSPASASAASSARARASSASRSPPKALPKALPKAPLPSDADPRTRFAVGKLERVAAELEALRATDRPHATTPAYLEARRGLRSVSHVLRKRARLSAEGLFGPEILADEGAGALAALDVALRDGDAARRARAQDELERGVAMARAELVRHGVDVRTLGEALPAAAFELGLVVLEATPSVGDGPHAVRADALGLLDLLEEGGSPLVAHVSPSRELEPTSNAFHAEVRALRAALEAAFGPRGFSERAALVRRTGALGALARAFVAECGVSTKPPYRARVPVRGNTRDEPVSALTVPEPRLPTGVAQDDLARVAELGRQLFFDDRLSSDRRRSCASCHMPARGFADGLTRPESYDPAVTLRHTPTLLYAPLQAALHWDGLRLSLEAQAMGVIHAKAEMGGDAEAHARTLAAGDPKAKLALERAGGVGAVGLTRALAAFLTVTFVPARSPLDRFARGDDAALSADMRAGLDVFAGRGRCARCHVPPLFGGNRPLDFATPVFSVVGALDVPEGKALDGDRGRAAITKRERDAFAFRTPTVRDVAKTAPYLHHGAYATLTQVTELYQRGGGRGFGVDVPRQDPDVRALRLTDEERRVLEVFLAEALTDEGLEKLVVKPSVAPAR